MGNRERAALSAHARRGRVGSAYTEFRWLVLRMYGPTCQGPGSCGGAITVFRGRTPASYTVGHNPPLSRGGAPLDLATARPMHYGCNASLGARDAPVLDTSRQW